MKPSKEELMQFEVLYSKDTYFASYARHLQSKWRVAKGYPKNNVIKENYGNFIETSFATNNKVNFLTENIQNLVIEKIIEINNNKGLIRESRMWNNLLSSQPLCFNLFGELFYDLDLATKLFKEVFTSKINKVTKIDFEFSSKRSKPDNSAFDVYIEYVADGKEMFWGIEVKYQESLREEDAAKALKNFERHRSEYIDLTQRSGYFKTDSIDKLRLTPIAQIWRDHLLSFNMSETNRQGSFIYLYPFHNKECNNGVNEYKKLLISEDEEINKFLPRDLFVFIKTLNKIHNTSWTRELVERYVGIL